MNRNEVVQIASSLGWDVIHRGRDIYLWSQVDTLWLVPFFDNRNGELVSVSIRHRNVTYSCLPLEICAPVGAADWAIQYAKTIITTRLYHRGCGIHSEFSYGDRL